MEKANFGTYDKDLLIKNYKEALQDDDFKEIVKSIELDNTTLMKYTSKLQNYKEELMHCKECKNLNECQNKTTGYVCAPHVQGTHLIFDNVACKYMNKKINDMENRCTFYDIPEALRMASMKDIDISDAKRVAVIKWLKNFYDNYARDAHQKGLYLHGSFGSGKTYLICAMLNELAKKGADVIVLYFPELLRNLKETFSLSERNIENDFSYRMKRLKTADILFIDDIGAESVTSWSRDEILGTILQYRMDANLPTFFSSNLNLEELENHLSSTKGSVDKVKARRIIERIKQLTTNMELISKNRRN